jgi:hypothetical protein
MDRTRRLRPANNAQNLTKLRKSALNELVMVPGGSRSSVANRGRIAYIPIQGSRRLPLSLLAITGVVP